MTEKISHPPVTQQPIELARVRCPEPSTNPSEGSIRWSPIKSITFVSMLFSAAIFAPLTASIGAIAACLFLTAATLCFGHSVGLHRLLIHRSFTCPLWLERCLVYLGVIVGMGGPTAMLYLHDMRDWAQRHAGCHRFYIHQNPIWKDAWWNLHCEIELEHPPVFRPEDKVASDPFYRFLDKTWRWQQLPLAVLLYLIGGWGWVVWGICVRLPMCLTGHWLIGYLAHNRGVRTWHLNGHAVQGYNLPYLGLISMGEAWHNNHHAYPGSAKHGHSLRQPDPGWWAIWTLEKLGLAKEIVLPEDHPPRAELEPLELRKRD